MRDSFDEIDPVTDADSLTDMVAQMKELSSGEGWLAKATRPLEAASPTSLALCWQHLRNCRLDSLSEVLDKELTLSKNCLSKGEFEGCVHS